MITLMVESLSALDALNGTSARVKCTGERFRVEFDDEDEARQGIRALAVAGERFTVDLTARKGAP